MLIEKNIHYPLIINVEIGEDVVIAKMSDGRTISIPLAWFEKLSSATKKQLSHFEISPAGYGIHWPDIDEDISVKAFIDGLASLRNL